VSAYVQCKIMSGVLPRNPLASTTNISRHVKYTYKVQNIITGIDCLTKDYHGSSDVKPSDKKV
jgi:hypothetical protein